MASQYPLVSFHFRVSGFGASGQDASFREVTGLSVQYVTEPVPASGQNNSTKTALVSLKYGDITLKRGVMASDSGKELHKWLKSTFEESKKDPKNLTIELLGEDHNIKATWKLINALPKGWKFSDLNADRGEVFIESIDLSIDKFVYEIAPDKS